MKEVLSLFGLVWRHRENGKPDGSPVRMPLLVERLTPLDLSGVSDEEQRRRMIFLTIRKRYFGKKTGVRIIGNIADHYCVKFHGASVCRNRATLEVVAPVVRFGPVRQ